MYEELKARLKHVARLEAEDYGAAPEDHASHQAAEAIEQLERQLAERDAEIAKYRDAPVVAWFKATSMVNEEGLWDYVEETALADNGGHPLIVKPGEQ